MDELPELWNILKGDMSFVGPRPLDENEQRQLESAIPGFDQRLMVRPGLTGLAQVYNSDDRAIVKFKYDIEYLERLSPWLDTKLILYSVLNSFGANWDCRTGKPQATAEEPLVASLEPRQDELAGNDKLDWPVD